MNYATAYMYAVTLCKRALHARLHVLRLELEYTDHDMVFTDLLQAMEALRARGVDHVLVVFDEQIKEWADKVETTLYYCGFDCCSPNDFPD